MLSDGYAYYEEWQNLVEKSDKQVKELLECFGSKCKSLKDQEKDQEKVKVVSYDWLAHVHWP